MTPVMIQDYGLVMSSYDEGNQVKCYPFRVVLWCEHSFDSWKL